SQEGKVLYFAMEYVDGLSLHALVAQRGPLEVGTACHYARQVAFGLRHAHDLGFVHRDIKPANLLLDRSGLVKILDLGLVRSEADAGAMLTRQFDKKNVLGTADYVAPEQAVDSSTVDARADVYSLGATLYFLLAGRPLFPEGRTAQKLVWQQIKEPPPLARLRPGVPPELAAMVHRMLKKRPADRFPTVGEVFDALAPFDPGDVPPPDLRWLPEPPARVALARPAPAPARPPGGSQSPIVIAAMRSGTGGSSAPLETGRPDSARLLAPTPGARPAPPRYDEPPAPAHDDTPAPSRRPSPALSRRPIALLVTLSVSLVLALAGIVVLLLRQ
ncbi:MAG: protein kinase domain-containing protein, partial [Gemmata sp.]